MCTNPSVRVEGSRIEGRGDHVEVKRKGRKGGIKISYLVIEVGI